MLASSSVRHRATMAAVVLLAAAVAVSAARAKNECHSGDKAALLAIMSTLGSNASSFQSWNSDTPCCDWTNVFCSNVSSTSPYTARRVIGLSLQDDDILAGPFPGAAIAGLTTLQQLLMINVPGVKGTIPHDLTRLNATLSFVDISSTGISGPVPSFLSEITALGHLRLSTNKLTGPIPASLGDMPNLYFLDLSNNRLTGTLPRLLFSKASDYYSDKYLYLSHNKLTGSVPAEFATVNFWGLDLSHNGFTGDASFLFGVNKSLDYLNLSHNVFDFNFSAVQLPVNLDGLDLSHNHIYGDIPDQVVDVTVTYFNVSYNRLTGVVPTGGTMFWFDASCFQHNKGLCGTPLPPCIKH
ncbi:hypothetical protein PR202_ga04494 [Eleusine coracana subsp. coracana]|uniref:Leucine-rich repeat-containing N-terminal plant-type domain-containing protein n=1 Tax=Eleusine coracana subsp. coracana TaxID=191504 RepID=A0AAV5BT70_ELECO|nr:hypothetical protein QOZ80_5AG0375280 [Eleusine coracana subsp. coracana]GJM88434.1 hypothetical protein PR202_ga04494 [Eleusine coracana subsp. coracana]